MITEIFQVRNDQRRDVGTREKFDILSAYELYEKNLIDSVSICAPLFSREKIEPFFKRCLVSTNG